MIPSDSLCRGPQQLSPQTPLKILPIFTPQVLAKQMPASCLSPSSSLPG